MIVAAVLLLPQFALAQSDELKVMSYNVRVGSAEDGTNSWMYRCSATLKMIEDQRPDVFGVQEALIDQVTLINDFTTDYDYVGVGRDNGKKEGEIMAIFWNKKKIKLLKSGTFWLSETPDEPSIGWDAACNRTATWAIMRCKETGREFLFVNTHLDHQGTQAQKNGLSLIADRIEELNPKNLPVVLVGDFNVRPGNIALKVLDSKFESTRKVAVKTDSHRTYNGWGKVKDAAIIDYIYMSGFTSCEEYQTVIGKYDDRKYISDHYPISARLIF